MRPSWSANAINAKFKDLGDSDLQRSSTPMDIFSTISRIILLNFLEFKIMNGHICSYTQTLRPSSKENEKYNLSNSCYTLLSLVICNRMSMKKVSRKVNTTRKLSTVVCIT